MVDVDNSTSKIILALDYSDREAALSLVEKLSPQDCRLKIGLELYTTAGNAFVRELVDRGFDVFLDLKFHDIPNTVARTCKNVAALGVWMTNVHALGGAAMMQAARNAIDDSAQQPLLIGVTILTSHDTEELVQLGMSDDLQGAVSRLAGMAQQAGLDGVVCSPLEVSLLRNELGRDFNLVTPGIRPQDSGNDDQQRIMTPQEAIALGSDYLVIGRPITQAKDPIAALSHINRSLLDQAPA